MRTVHLLLLVPLALVPTPAIRAAEPAAAGDGARAEAPPPASALVVKVYDGDTVTLATGDRVRLRFVNTPELKPHEEFAEEARDLARELVLNKRVDLSYGPVVRDGYGRLIASISVEGRDLATALLEAGYAHVFVVPPADGDLGPLLRAQERARAESRGIWSTERYRGPLHITSFHANAPGDDRENLNGEYLRVCNVSSGEIDLADFRLADISGQVWPLPHLRLPPGYTVAIHSGSGENQVSPDAPLHVYLGSDRPIWNNKRDRATIYDAEGHVVDSRLHEVRGR